MSKDASDVFDFAEVEDQLPDGGDYDENDESDDEDDGKSIEDIIQGLASRGYTREMLCFDKVLDSFDLEGIANKIRDGGAKNIIVMTGAGLSTSAGIPDFRTPGTGLYDNLEKFGLPFAEAIFEIGFFKKNPKPFFVLSKELYPGNFKPTPSHYFIRLLHEKGLLLRLFTQNIDTLERQTGLPDEKIVEAHGSFHTAHCIGCRREYSQAWVKEIIFADEVPKCEDCEALVKPVRLRHFMMLLTSVPLTSVPLISVPAGHHFLRRGPAQPILQADQD
jgi:NAD-dependent deacetylase sirtuin 2